MSEMKSLTLNDKTYDSFVDKLARSLSYGSAVIGSASGESFTFDDASNYNPLELHVYGKTTQDGIPTPDNPVELGSIGSGGSITVNVTGDGKAQSMTIATPNGLPGIPVSEGGNYTDANGQQWVCDEIDFAKGCLIRRIQRITFDQINDVFRRESPVDSGIYRFDILARAANQIVNTRFSTLNLGLCNAFRFHYSVLGSNTRDNCISTYSEGGLYARCDSIETAEEFLQTARAEKWEVLAILETPVEVPLSAEELETYAALHTYRDRTTVSNDASAHMAIEYVMDAKKYIASLVGSSFVDTATVE